MTQIYFVEGNVFHRIAEEQGAKRRFSLSDDHDDKGHCWVSNPPIISGLIYQLFQNVRVTIG